ncbi:hypothetical protein ACH4CE_36615 [Streptomyces gelaticus]|uniref:hypothetical protein n=1 Tax=Streptomyces gelaticus TaxID=285446 RepID=UPI00378A3C7B
MAEIGLFGYDGEAAAAPAGALWSHRCSLTPAIRDRRRERAALLTEEGRSSTTEHVPTLALVEIDRAKDFTSADHDVKFTLRLGSADAGGLTQFIAVPNTARGYNSEKNKEFLATKAWDGGLRQLGMRVRPEHSLGDRLPEGMRCMAVWTMRRNRRSHARWAGCVPTGVLVAPEPSDEELARVQGWDEARAWGAVAAVHRPIRIEPHSVTPTPTPPLSRPLR